MDEFDLKLLRALRGKNVKVTHGLEESLAQLAAEPEEFRAAVETFIVRLRLMVWPTVSVTLSCTRMAKPDLVKLTV